MLIYPKHYYSDHKVKLPVCKIRNEIIVILIRTTKWSTVQGYHKYYIILQTIVNEHLDYNVSGISSQMNLPKHKQKVCLPGILENFNFWCVKFLIEMNYRII